MPDANYISITDAAKEKRCSRATLYRAAKEGRINAVQVAGRKLVVEDDTWAAFEPNRVGRRAAMLSGDDE